MQGLIMDMPLMISAAMRHAADFHGKTEVVARTIEGDVMALRQLLGTMDSFNPMFNILEP